MKIDGKNLKIEDVVNVARYGEKVEISQDAIRDVRDSRKKVERIIKSGETVYGINTGLGELVRIKIGKEDLENLQMNLVRSHASGVGRYMDDEIVRAAMLIRANSLLNGLSGVREEVIISLIKLLNSDIVPLVPQYGSVGASGDLAPLAAISLVLIGEGKCKYRGKIVNSKYALKKEGIEKISLKEKEGLALLNGTAVMSAYASLAVYDSYVIMKNAILSSVLSFSALDGIIDAYDMGIMKARPHPGQIKIGKILKNILKDLKRDKHRVQDAYTLRCIPQVYGAVLDTVNYARTVVEREINSVTDNPLIFDRAISGCNFHGEPVALVMDFLGIALTDLGNMIERRIARLIDSKLSNLPPFLIENSGLNSGFMIPQYTAASLCNRNKILSYPASADSIPTSANQEDHVSMGLNSGIKLREIVENVKYIISIEYLCGNQAMHFKKSTKNIEKLMQRINIPKITRDVSFTPIIEEIKRKIDNDEIIKNFRILL